MGIRICTIGCGELATAEHGPSYRKYADEHDGVELAACCDLDEGKAVAFKRKFGFAAHYTDIDTMLDVEKPDAVCLVVPTLLTAELSVKVLEKGYPLMMEKPPGLNKAEILQMIKAAKKKNTPNQVSFNRRHMPLIAKGKK